MMSMQPQIGHRVMTKLARRLLKKIGRQHSGSSGYTERIIPEDRCVVKTLLRLARLPDEDAIANHADDGLDVRIEDTVEVPVRHTILAEVL